MVSPCAVDEKALNIRVAILYLIIACYDDCLPVRDPTGVMQSAARICYTLQHLGLLTHDLPVACGRSGTWLTRSCCHIESISMFVWVGYVDGGWLSGVGRCDACTHVGCGSQEARYLHVRSVACVAVNQLDFISESNGDNKHLGACDCCLGKHLQWLSRRLSLVGTSPCQNEAQDMIACLFL